MKYKLLLSLLIFSSVLFAQESKADKKYQKYAYIDAIQIYERIVAKGHKSKDLFQKLGNAYYFNGVLEKAENWYSQLFELHVTLEPEYYFRYAQALKSLKKYDKADKMMEQFYQLTNDYRGKLYVENREYLTEINKKEEKYTIEDAGINSKESEYGGTFFNGKLYFTSSRKFLKEKNHKDNWTNQNFTNILTANLDEKGKPVFIDELKDDVNSKFHESSVVFSKDGKTVYFTRSNSTFKKGKDNNDNTVILKIYTATNDKEKWINLKELPFNNQNYSCAHPSLSSDEKTLYFVSDMPGSYGGSDLYKVAVNSDGTFGTPENLGPQVNTKARETFPFIDKNNTLYFATDGRPGLGGLDIFCSKMEANGSFSSFENLGTPVNSEKDDFAFVNTSDKSGYFSSNRPGGMGFDDIYKFNEKEPPATTTCNSIVVDSETNSNIPSVKLSLYDANHNLIKEFESDKDGKYAVDLLKDREYYLKGEKEGYLTNEMRISGNAPLPEFILKLDPKIQKINQGTDLAKVFGIVIYFSFDKHIITPEAEVELAKIIEVMQQNPTIIIEIGSHTDSRQSAAYNLRLSNFRANSTMKYMISKGINPSRISAKGYGESKLVNGCKDGVPCSEEEHQKNRRSEFVIINL
jgi:outer membrane protein OmpA-like peptidoglycan-associated protein/tetratricopeptide (TPR) repeat protein